MMIFNTDMKLDAMKDRCSVVIWWKVWILRHEGLPRKLAIWYCLFWVFPAKMLLAQCDDSGDSMLQLPHLSGKVIKQELTWLLVAQLFRKRWNVLCNFWVLLLPSWLTYCASCDQLQRYVSVLARPFETVFLVGEEVEVKISGFERDRLHHRLNPIL